MGSFTSEYNKLRQKRLEEEKSGASTPKSDDIAPLYSSIDFSAPILPSAKAVESATNAKNYRAAVRAQEEAIEAEKMNTWVQKGATEDGFSAGKLAKGIGATVGDVGLGVAKGALKTAEGISDLFWYSVEQGAKKLGLPAEVAEFAHDSAAMYSIDDVTKIADKWLDKNSFLGNKTEPFEEALGQVAAIILTGGAGGGSQAAATAITTGVTATSSMGSSMSEAYQSGADDGEAWAYGAWSGAVDAGTELLFGGLGKTVNAVGVSKGISSLDDMFAKKLSSKISNQFAANMVELGVKAGAEGTEEVLAGIGSAVGKKLTYMSDEELTQLIEDEDLLNQFVVGAVTSGIAQSGIVPGMQRGSLIESTAQGKDFVTGLTQSETKVIEKEVEKRIAEKEANGEKLTNKQKNEIYDKVVEDLDKGYISIDTIEEALGGEAYTEYKNSFDNENALKQEAEALRDEFNELNRMKKSDMTGEQSDRLEELRTQLQDIRTRHHESQNESAQFKEWLDSEVFDLAKGSRLENSYIENDNRGKVFTADLSKYDEKTRATVQKAIDSGILNNTNRTHEFVDIVAKISADTGVSFDFANNESLKESGFAVDGALVNGVVTKDGIKINIDSPKAWQTTVGHEITHVLEGTELYTELQNAITEYAKTKGDYDTRLEKLTKLYENVEGADITADLVSDYLFEDSDFIANLSRTNRNVFQKIYDEIKHLLKLVTAGSKEARQLEAVKKAFNKAYKAGGEASGDTKYSVDSENSIDKEAEKRYNAYGWVSDNHIINAGQRANFDSKFAGVVARGDFANKAKSGEYMIPVSDIYDSANEGVENTIVYAKGTIEEPIITAVVKIDADNETDLSELRRELYEAERRGIQQKIEGVLRRYNSFDYANTRVEQRGQQGRSGYNNKLGAERRTSSGKAERAVSYRTTEEGHRVYYFENDIAPINEVSSTDDAFFDGKNTKHSLSSSNGETQKKYGDYYTPANELRYKGESIAPTGDDLSGKVETSAAGKNTAPMQNAVQSEFEGVADGFAPITEAEANEMQSEILNSLDDTDAPPEIAPTYYGEDVTTGKKPTTYNPFENRDYQAVGNAKVKAFMDEHPEVKPFFQSEANIMLGEHRDTVRGERWYNDWVNDLSYDGVSATNASYVSGTKRHTTESMADMLDNGKGVGKGGYSYGEIKAALEAIAEDKPQKNACAKRIEFILNDRLLNGYTDLSGVGIPANQEYINLINEMQNADAVNEARQSYFDSIGAEDIAPVVNSNTAQEPPNIAPTGSTAKASDAKPPKIADVMTEEPKVSKEKRSILNKFRTNFADKGAVIEDLALETGNRELDAKYNFMHYSESRAQEYINKHLKPIVDAVESTGKTQQLYEYAYHLHNIDRMSLESNENRVKREALREKFKGLNDKQIANIAKEWIKHGTPKDVADRIRAAREYMDTKKSVNKPVFGDSVTADVSRETVKKLESENPEFKELSNAIVAYNTELRKMLVAGNVISQETADLWAKQYPHYVPIRRLGKDGLGVTVPLDTRKTGVNAPIKRAKGGNSDILPLFDTMALRTEQTFKAIAKNSFGVELMHTLDSVIESETLANGILPEGTQVRAHDRENIGVIKSYNEETGKYTVYFENKKGQSATVQLDAKTVTPLNPVAQATDGGVDEILDSLDNHEELLKKGENGQKPTFTVFENGKRVTFEITEDIYDSLKGTSDGLKYTNKVANVASNAFRGLLTEYNPVFMINNAAKDVQDILINSQHPAKTYANIPGAIKELTTKGEWYTEYMENGGAQNTYFDSDSKTFKEENSKWVKAVGMPIRSIKEANNFIERVPRLAEYIASRKAGASVEVAMLDAARVTTNFAAGGDVTKFLNRNGATFLNASVQGFNQQVRNVREAKANGVKGWLSLAAKVTIAGLPAVLLNNLLWDDDEEYEELADYVKDNYYIVAKTEDGTFIRLPKGRTVAVIQNAFEQMDNLITGDDDLDFSRFFELAISNLAPNNPIDNNLISPIVQTANNETWYGEDLVPVRLQDLPAAEQYDESTDKFSKWIGETFNVSPYKVNYLLDRYSGGVGDVVLPYLTPEADGGGIFAPFKDKFTTDSVMNNQNVSDFYDTVDELTKNANSMYATDEDVLRSKYMNSVSSELGELYQQKREIQNSNLDDDEKYEAVREIQEQINELTRVSLDTYEDVNIDGVYASVGDRHYVKKDGVWTKLTDDQQKKMDVVTSGLGISASEYFSNKEEYDFAYEKPDKYTVAKAVGGYTAYKSYSSELYDIKADKDEDGKSIAGSRKEKVIDYINNLGDDVDYGIKLILFKNEYNSDDTYNYEIIDYLNSRQDISYKEMETILKELGFTVDSNGNIYWD